MDSWLRSRGFDASIFALVHDSILAEVKEEFVDEYVEKLQSFVQMDRGVSIPNCPVGCDFEIGEDYSMGKFDKVYGEEFNARQN